MSERKPLIAGNWKMNLGGTEGCVLAQDAGSAADSGTRGHGQNGSDIPAQMSTQIPDFVVIVVATEIGLRWVWRGLRWVVIGPEVAESSYVVIGRFPKYTQVAEDLAAKRFSVPKEIWSAMTKEEKWVANQKFLDRAIARGDEFLLASPASAAEEGTVFARELEHILSTKKYAFNPQGTALVPTFR